jgi:hypothetical protein
MTKFHVKTQAGTSYRIEARHIAADQGLALFFDDNGSIIAIAAMPQIVRIENPEGDRVEHD